MGFLDDLKDAFSKQATKPKSNKTQGEKIVENILTATATLNGKTKEATIKVVSPTIKSVTWGIPIKERKTKPRVTITTIDAKEIDKTANGVNTSLYIKTEQAERCNALIVLESEAWEGYFESHLILIGNTGKTDLKEQDTVVITPDTKHWKKTSTKNSKISATVYLFTYTSRTWSLEDNPEALALSFNRKLKSPNPSISPSCAEQFRRLIVHKSMKSEIDFDYCGHGMEYRYDIKRVQGASDIGPRYWGSTSIKDFVGWNGLLENKKITKSERMIISAVGVNEGCLEAVQSYDSEMLSMGAMQKTINPEGLGQLPKQIMEFKREYPDVFAKYECCFAHTGWKLEEGNKMTYKGLVGSSAKGKIREGIKKENRTCEPIEPFIKLAHDETYQLKQVLDFKKALSICLTKSPQGYVTYKVTDFVKSDLGKAVILDQYVNRTAHVEYYFGKALDIFFKKEVNSKIPKNPNEWKDNHSKYETLFLDIYGPLREEKFPIDKKYGMTDGKGRYTRICNFF